MSKAHKRSDSLKRKHWSIKATENLVSRNSEGHFCLNVEGGAENGLMPFVGEIRQDKIHYQSGKLHHGDIIVEVNSKRVAGMIKKDVIALIKRSADPVSLLTVKQNATITKDIRQYLSTRFTKNSVDSELQHQIRENLHMRVVPCTTRRPQDSERQGIDYNFIDVESFKQLEKCGQLLESGSYEGNFYGTPKPPSDPPHSNMIQAYSRSTAATGYTKEGVISSDSISGGPRPGGPRGPPGHHATPKALGPLPANWEIAYTENNEKYFIDHITGTTHWLDPRLAHYMKHNMMECQENELPYGWEKVNDPVYGTYFIDHVNRNTQYENPVVQAKRQFAGSQLPQRSHGYGMPPPPHREPPSFQSAAALEKQREAEAAAMWPDAGLSDPVDNYPYPYQSQPNDHDLETELHGDVVFVTLQKTASGFGFTIIGGDRPGELLQIKSIVRGSVSDRDGRLQVGDVLVRINGISVLTYNHRKVVDLFQSLPLNSDVSVEVRRGYPLQDFRGDELPSYNESSHGYGGDIPSQPPQDGYSQQNSQPPQHPERVAVHIVKGPLGFGFSLGESELGPLVKQIMDHPRCAQLQEGDILMEINGEKVRSYTHADLVTVLKRCPKGNQATFVVYRHPPEELPSYSGPDSYPPSAALEGAEGHFTTMEVRLMRQVSGFGFRIIGGEEEGSQATVGAIVSGGAADLDGRMQIGDEISHINGYSVVNASHREVISLMGEAAAQGEVVLGIRRKMPFSESVPPPGSYNSPIHNQYSEHGNQEADGLPRGPRDVTVDRPNMQTSFGFVLQSNTLRAGCMICRLVPGSPAEDCNQLYTYDELLSVNGRDVSRMDHVDIVALIKSSGTAIHLIVQQPEDMELLNRQQMIMDQEGGQGGQMPADMQGHMHSNMHGGPPPPPQEQWEGEQDDRRNYQDYPGMDEDAPPQISADLSDIASDDEEILHLDICRSGGGFGFSIRGGAEYNSPLCVLRIADGGAAQIDGRLRVGDELLEINGNSTVGMLHSDAITIIKHGGDVVKLIIRRVPDEPFVGGKSDGTVFSPTAVQTKDRYAQEYMNSLGPTRGSREYPPN